jgi:hypothetical protein
VAEERVRAYLVDLLLGDVLHLELVDLFLKLHIRRLQ